MFVQIFTRLAVCSKCYKDSSRLAVIGLAVAAKKSCNFNGGERITIRFEPKIFDCKMRGGGVAWHFHFLPSSA